MIDRIANIDCDDIRRTLNSGATLLDVRNTAEFNNGALPDAKNIPLAILPMLAHEHMNRHDPVLVYCQSGGRAIMAEKILASLGFTNVTSIGGMHHYQHCN